jgi:hypothetical protein
MVEKAARCRLIAVRGQLCKVFSLIFADGSCLAKIGGAECLPAAAFDCTASGLASIIGAAPIMRMLIAPPKIAVENGTGRLKNEN